MRLIFWLIPLLFLTLNPITWKKNLNNDNRGMFIFIQVVRFIIGASYAFLINYLFLVDKTPTALYSHVSWIVGILLIVDFFLWSEEGSLLQIVNGVIGLVLVVSFLYMTIIYPHTIYGELFSLVQGEVKEERLESMDIEHIPVVPLEYAKYKGEKVLGQVKNYSFYEVGHYSKQKIDNELYWVAPIVFEGYFSSRKAGTIPGYIKVSAEDEKRQPELVTGYEMKYVPSAYFGNNLYRIVRKKYPEIVIMEASFEPDENGKPYYAVTYGHYKNYRNGHKVDGVIMFDPVTGKMKDYKMDEVPDFVDQTIPLDVAEDYNIYYGEYKHGFKNRFFTKRDIHSPTGWESGEEVVGVFGPNGRMYWFTDHTTSSNESTSMVGYSLMDARSGEFTYYIGSRGYLNGYAALEAVNKSFEKDKWFGTQPILYNIYGQDTWVIPVIDGNGLLRSISLVHAESGSVTYSSNKRKLFEQYKNMLATNQIKSDNIPTNISELKEIEGTVLRVEKISTPEGTIVKVLLIDSDKIFNIDGDLIPYSLFTKEGDRVSIKYIDNEESNVTVREFKNNTINK